MEIIKPSVLTAGFLNSGQNGIPIFICTDAPRVRKKLDDVDRKFKISYALLRYLIELAGDVHHIFPKEYLKVNGYDKNQYNQDANYAFLDTQVNRSIGKKAPCEYLSEAVKQCETKEVTCGSITDLEQLKKNLEINCIPFEACSMDYHDYPEFLEARRKLMAKKIKEYYYSL